METKNASYCSLLREFPDFPAPGIVFVDWMPILAHADAYRQLIDDLLELLPERRFTKVAALESRGFFLGLTLAQRLGAGFVPIRKKGKLPGPCYSESYTLEYGTAAIEIQQDALEVDEHVLVVDDLLATGGTMAAANRLVKRVTRHVTNLFFIELDALKGGEKIDVPYRALLHR